MYEHTEDETFDALRRASFNTLRTEINNTLPDSGDSLDDILQRNNWSLTDFILAAKHEPIYRR